MESEAPSLLSLPSWLFQTLLQRLVLGSPFAAGYIPPCLCHTSSTFLPLSVAPRLGRGGDFQCLVTPSKTQPPGLWRPGPLAHVSSQLLVAMKYFQGYWEPQGGSYRAGKGDQTDSPESVIEVLWLIDWEFWVDFPLLYPNSLTWEMRASYYKRRTGSPLFFNKSP